MRKNIIINDEVMQKAMNVTGLETKKDVVDLALRELVVNRSRKDLLDIKGRIAFAEGYDYKGQREGR